MVRNIGSWLRIMVRQGGVLWVTTPYALVIGGLGFLGFVIYSNWGWHFPNEIHGLLLIFLGFLLFSIINSAAQVYIQGRQFLGSINNAFRDLSRQIASFAKEDKDKELLKKWLLLLGAAIRLDLGGERVFFAIREHLTDPEKEALVKAPVVFTILGWISQKLSEMESGARLLTDHRVAMGENLTAINNNFGSCRRVQKAQLPVDFHVLGGLAITFFCITLPFVIVDKVGLGVVPVMIVVGYLLVGMLEIAFQTKDPFGTDANDLNMDEFQTGVESGIEAMFAATLPEETEDQIV